MRRPAIPAKPTPPTLFATMRAAPRLPIWLIALLLALLTIALYWPTTGHDFINFDDPNYVTSYPHVLGGLTWGSAGWAFTTMFFGLWHPLTWISHMLDCQCFGLRPGGHHLTGLLLHAANTLLLFVVLHRMTGARWRSAIVAALFALHPLHVESVAWVSERKDVLSTFFVMLTLWAYHRYTRSLGQEAEGKMQKPVAFNTQHGTRNTLYASRFTLHAFLFYLLSLCFFAFGLMSKPMIVTLPGVLLLLDYWPLARMQTAEGRRQKAEGGDTQPLTRSPLSQIANRKAQILFSLLVEKLPFLGLALLTSLITLRAAKGVGSLPTAAECPLPNRMANVVLSYADYCLNAFWPGNLAIYYPFPPTFSGWSVAGVVLLLAAISVAAVCMARRWPYLVVGWLWYLVTLLPVIGLIQLAAYSHADRYTYVPLIGVFLGLTWGAYDLTRGWRHQVLALSVAGAAAIASCAGFTHQQIGYWKNSETLFRHALAVTKDNWMAHNNLGNALDKQGQIDESIRHYQEAIRLHPEYALAHNNLGKALGLQGQTDEAIRQFQETIRLKPDHADAHCNLGVALSRKGQLDEAIRQYQEAIRLEPDNAQPHNNLGIAFYNQGRAEEAVRQFEEALRLKPGYADAHKGLDVVLAAKAALLPPPGTATNR